MKRFYILSMAIIAILTISCNKEVYTGDNSPEVRFETLTLSASSDETVSKTILDGKSVKWCGGESVSVFSCEAVAPANNEFKMSGQPTGSSAKFEGEIEEGTDNIVAIYPYIVGNSFASDVVSSVVPVEQTATAGSFADGASLLYHRGAKDDVMKFRSVCTIVYFTLPSDVTFASSVTISANNGAKIAGACIIDKNGNLVVDQVNGSATVILKGSFAGGNRYYATIAPGTYAGGFSFTVATAGGNTYLRTNALDMVLDANTINNLGTLALTFDDSVFTVSATINHDVTDGKLNGSVAAAKVDVSVPSEFDGFVKSWTAELRKGSSVVRSATSASFGTSATLDRVGDFYYLSAGTYDLTVTLNYVSGGKTRTVSKTFTAACSSVAPSGLAFKHAAYSSYSYYAAINGKDKNISKANDCDGSTIYDQQTVDWSSALSQEVYNQCSELIVSSNFKIDGNAVSGESSAYTWAAHTASADVSFDGQAQGNLSSTVYVTGLPYEMNFRQNNTVDMAKAAGWSLYGTVGARSSQLYIANGGNYGYIVSPAFYVPSSTNIHIEFLQKYYGTIGSTIKSYVEVCSSNSYKAVANEQTISSSNNTSADGGRRTTTYDLQLSDTNKYVSIACKDKTTWAAVTYYYVHNFKVTYR